MCSTTSASHAVIFGPTSGAFMTQQNPEAAKEISDLENGPEAETLSAHTQDQNSAVLGAVKRPAALRGILERRWRRKNDINSLAGLIREHARVIAAMHNGRIPIDKADILSRAYGRHREMVTALEQQSQLDAIQQQLAALRGEPSGQLLIDEGTAKEPAT